MSNHTPGPWCIEFGGTINDDGFSICGKVEPGLICERWPPYVGSMEYKVRMCADAKLIAAAPEMYEILKTAWVYTLPTSQQQAIAELLSRIEGTP